MNKKLLKLLAITACSLTFATTLSVGVTSLDNLQTATAHEITFDGADALVETCAQGSTISIPMGSIEGVKATSFVIISPSGYGYNTETFTVSEAGKYTVRWYATVGGKEVFAEKTFMATKSAFSGEGEYSCEYMEDLDVAQFANYDAGTFKKENVTTEGDGIKVTVGQDAKFTYNSVIDLRDFSTEPFIEIFPYQQLGNVWTAPSGSYCEFKDDAKNYLVTLTDCYDSSKYVTIDLEYLPVWTYAHRANAYYMSYRAGAAGQTMHGLNKSTKGKIKIDNEAYVASFAPSRGADGSNVSQLGMKLYYDTATQRVYMDFAEFICSKNDGVWCKRVLIADLANKDIYPDNAFEGFTTGEIYLSLSAKNLLDNEAHMDITSIGGKTGQAMLGIAQDTEPPLIKTNEKLEQMKTIALGEEISIPNALVLDPNNALGLNAKVAVYYDYDPNSATNALVGIVNGKFTPKKAGTYTIVYTAEDSNQNFNQVTVDLICQEIAGGNAVNLTIPAVEVEAGDYADLPECTVSGLYTDASILKIYYTDVNGKQKLYTDSQIFLDRLGDFEFTYVYETPFKTYTVTAIITALETERVVMGDPALPEYFIQNAKYTLDTVLAYQYTAVPTDPVESTMYMKADDGEYVEVDPKEVTIPVASTVQFKYVYGAGVVETAPIKVLNVGFGAALSTVEYFYDEDNAFTKTAAKDGLQFVTNGPSVEGTLEYINVLALSSFDIEFTFPSKDKAGTTYVEPTSVTFTFVDYYDRNNVATFKMRPAKAGLYVDVNGVQRVGQIVGRKFLDLKTYFNYKDGFIKFEGTEYDLGDVIKSDRILFSIAVEGSTKGASCMNLSLLCDNVLTSAKFDSTTPKLNITKTNMGYHSYGSVITLSQATASDLIAPYLEAGLKVTMRMPDGTFAKSVDGVTLDGTNPANRDYQVKLDQVGFYSVLYTYTDQNGGFESFSYSPIVKDEQGPTIVVDGKVKDEVVSAKWGASVTVATYSVSDDISLAENVKSYINVIYPSGIMRRVENGGTFYAEEKGQYTIAYYALDEIGNMSLFTYYVVVS